MQCFLCRNNTLERWDLRENKLADDCIQDLQDLAEALRVNTGLRSLDLSSNAFLSGGADVLLAALKSNYTLHDLQLDNNKFNETSLEQIEAWVRRNRGDDLALQLQVA